MMKKTVSLLLAVCLLCAVCVPALGEGCYEVIKSAILSMDGFDSPETLPQDNSDRQILLYYSADEGVLSLTGTNEQENGEMYLWRDVDQMQSLTLFYSVCILWDSLIPLAGDGYTLCLTITSSSSSGPIVISTSAEAHDFVQFISELLGLPAM